MFVDILFVVLVVGLLVAIYKLKFQNQPTSTRQTMAEPEQPQQPVRGASWATTNDDEQQLDSEDDEQKVGGKADIRRQMRKEQKMKEKQQRKEAMEHFLEEQKKKRQKYDEEQEKKAKLEEEKRLKEEQYYKMLVEEEEKKKKAQYDKWKNMFSVEEEGVTKETPEQQEKKKAQFRNTLCQYLKRSKLSLLEDLSHKFKLPTKEIIAKIKELEELQMINGIFDERGKYLSIEEKQWQAIKNYVKARGRIKKTDIMHECAKIIKIPEKTDIEEDLMKLINEEEK